MLREETGAKAGKSLPVIVTVEPGELLFEVTEMEAAGTEWVAVEEPGAGALTMLAVTVLVEGMEALMGT